MPVGRLPWTVGWDAYTEIPSFRIATPPEILHRNRTEAVQYCSVTPGGPGVSTANSGSDRERLQRSFVIYCAASARSRQFCSSFSSFFFSSGSTQSLGQPFIPLRFGLVVVRFGQHDRSSVHLVKRSGVHPFHEIGGGGQQLGNGATNEPPRQSRLSGNHAGPIRRGREARIDLGQAAA
jgi:hypothetical protein